MKQGAKQVLSRFKGALFRVQTRNSDVVEYFSSHMCGFQDDALSSCQSKLSRYIVGSHFPLRVKYPPLCLKAALGLQAVIGAPDSLVSYLSYLSQEGLAQRLLAAISPTRCIGKALLLCCPQHTLLKAPQDREIASAVLVEAPDPACGLHAHQRCAFGAAHGISLPSACSPGGAQEETTVSAVLAETSEASCGGLAALAAPRALA